MLNSSEVTQCLSMPTSLALDYPKVSRKAKRNEFNLLKLFCLQSDIQPTFNTCNNVAFGNPFLVRWVCSDCSEERQMLSHYYPCYLNVFKKVGSIQLENVCLDF